MAADTNFVTRTLQICGSLLYTHGYPHGWMWMRISAEHFCRYRYRQSPYRQPYTLWTEPIQLREVLTMNHYGINENFNINSCWSLHFGRNSQVIPSPSLLDSQQILELVAHKSCCRRESYAPKVTIVSRRKKMKWIPFPVPKSSTLFWETETQYISLVLSTLTVLFPDVKLFDWF